MCAGIPKGACPEYVRYGMLLRASGRERMVPSTCRTHLHTHTAHAPDVVPVPMHEASYLLPGQTVVLPGCGTVALHGLWGRGMVVRPKPGIRNDDHSGPTRRAAPLSSFETFLCSRLRRARTRTGREERTAKVIHQIISIEW